MFERENSLVIPTESETAQYINNHLWIDFCSYMEDTYHALPKWEFSKCSMEYGWNAKFKKGSKALCTVYPRENYFTVMIVVGRKQKETVESALSDYCPDIQQIYNNTNEGNGQRWLMIDLEDSDNRYEDVKKLIALRVK